MKKARLLFLLLPLLLLGGRGSLYAQRREIEQLRLVETMGLDPSGGGVLLSLGTAAGVGGEDARCYSASGVSLSDAKENLRRRSMEEMLFCGHLQQILIGEAAAREGLEPFLAAVCRSSDLRLDTPVYLLLGGTAREAMTGTGDGHRGLTEALQAVEARQGEDRLSTAGTILRDLERQGCALVRTLRRQPASEEEADAHGETVVPDGFGILVGGVLSGQIGPENAAGAAALTDSLGPCTLVLEDVQGGTVTLELEESTLSLSPIWSEGDTLSGLDLSLRVRAVVMETGGFAPVADETALNAIRAGLEEELSRQVGQVLEQSRALQADFLGLGQRIERLSPRRGRGLGSSLGPLLPTLRMRVTVQSELSHSNDLN